MAEYSVTYSPDLSYRLMSTRRNVVTRAEGSSPRDAMMRLVTELGEDFWEATRESDSIIVYGDNECHTMELRADPEFAYEGLFSLRGGYRIVGDAECEGQKGSYVRLDLAMDRRDESTFLCRMVPWMPFDAACRIIEDAINGKDYQWVEGNCGYRSVAD